MKNLFAPLYVALVLIAIPLTAATLDIYDKPEVALSNGYETIDGDTAIFGPSETELRVVNFWAIWCGPCRKELPSLDALAGVFLQEELQVFAIATGRNDRDQVDEFLGELGVENLNVGFDPRSRLASEAGVLALPHTIILNTKGEEVARLIGEADWADPEIIAQIKQLQLN